MWAWRMEVGDRSVVVATGGVDGDGGLTYEADELVVIFDAAKAHAYRPAPEDESAWGAPLVG